MDPGFIYILNNAAMPGMLKIGLTTRREDARSKELSRPSGVAAPFGIVHQVRVDRCGEAEREIHARLAHCRFYRKREFFVISSREAIEIVDAIASKYVFQPATDESSSPSAKKTSALAPQKKFPRGGTLFLVGNVLTLLAAVFGLVTHLLISPQSATTEKRQTEVRSTPRLGEVAEESRQRGQPALPEAEQRRRGETARLQAEKEASQRKKREESEHKRLEERRKAELRFAKKLIDEGEVRKAKGRLEDIVRDYPGSSEAEESERILKDMAKK
jgi:T5orf172 domain-containing protein